MKKEMWFIDYADSNKNSFFEGSIYDAMDYADKNVAFTGKPYCVRRVNQTSGEIENIMCERYWYNNGENADDYDDPFGKFEWQINPIVLKDYGYYCDWAYIDASLNSSL